jgi:peptide/nickel transport system substrate-binding protein
MSIRRRTAFAVAALAAMILVPPCEVGAQGSEIRIQLNADIRSTNPGINRDAETDTVMHHVVEGLVAYRNDLGVAPMLADSWTLEDDGRSYVFRLRDGVRFHNGRPLTAAEVKWTWDRLMSPRTAWPCRPWFDGTGETGIKLLGVDALDERTVRFRLEAPNGLFLNRIANLICNAGILHPDSVGADGSWAGPVGTGPYRVGRWRRNEFVELVRFEGYSPRPEPRDGYAGSRAAQIDRLRWVVIADPAAAQAALLAGDIDVVPGLPLQSLAEVEGRRGIVLHRQEALDWQTLLVHTNDPLFRDVRLRQAIAHAIDREALVRSATNGLAGVNPSAVGRSLPYFTDVQRRALPYDPARARALLAEAGYGGQPVRLQTQRNSQLNFNNAVTLQAMLTEAGFNVQLDVLDWATMFQNYRRGAYQLMAFGWSARPDPTLLYDAFTGDRARFPASIYGNPEAIDLVRRSGLETDRARRQVLFDRIHELMIRDAAIIGLYNSYVVDAVSARVAGYEMWSMTKPRFWGVSVER